MKRIIFFSIIIATAFFISCNTDEIDVFGEQDYVYFNIDDNYGALRDDNGFIKMQCSFALNPDKTITEMIYQLPIKVAGLPQGYNRPVTFEVVDSLTTAVQGEHYSLLQESDSQISEGETEGVMQIKVLKTPEMDDEIFKLAIKIVDNENLKAGPEPLVIVSLSNTYDKPSWWSSWGPLKSFTRVKCGLWLEYMEVSDGSNPWDVEPYIYYIDDQNGDGLPDKRTNESAQYESVRLFIEWLKKGDENGNPYIDENGQLVVDTFL